MQPQSYPCRAWPERSIEQVWRAPDGWPCRLLRLSPPADVRPRGSLLFLGGRGDQIEKHVEAIARWAAMGWEVSALEWRGQAGAGRLLPDARIGHSPGFDRWIDDLAAFGREWRAHGMAPHVAIAHSMGGHLLLKAMVEGAFLPDAAVLTAPMLGLQTRPLPVPVGAWIARTMCALGLGNRAAWDHGDKPIAGMAQRQARLTHSAERYSDEMWWREQRPDLALGGPSWAWLRDAFASTLAMPTDPRLSAMSVPALILAARHDRLVSTAAAEKIARRLPDAQFHCYGAVAGHELLREADDVRDDVLARIDTFLDARAPAG